MLASVTEVWGGVRREDSDNVEVVPLHVKGEVRVRCKGPP